MQFYWSASSRGGHRPTPPAAPLRWSLCPNRPQESGLGDLQVALHPRPADHGRWLVGIAGRTTAGLPRDDIASTPLFPGAWVWTKGVVVNLEKFPGTSL
jgi:hypothetical protein